MAAFLRLELQVLPAPFEAAAAAGAEAHGTMQGTLVLSMLAGHAGG